MTTLATIVVIIIIAGIALKLAVPSLSSKSVASGIISANGESALGDCPDTPNCQGSESSRHSQKVKRFNLTQPASEAIATLASIAGNMSGTQIITQDERYLHTTFKTPIMGYTDDVEFLLSDDNQSVQVRSASRLGKSDLGANAKRLSLIETLVEGKI